MPMEPPRCFDASRTISRKRGWPTQRFLAENPKGAVVPIATKLSEMPAAMAKLTAPAIARAGSGVIYAHYAENAPARAWNGDFETMKRIKEMFDPEHLLNRGRLYGRI